MHRQTSASAVGSGAAIQPDHTRVVELRRGVLPKGDAQALSLHRSKAGAMGQTQVQDADAAQDAQCGLAASTEERISRSALSLEGDWAKGWVMGAV